jgi:UDP-N-acetylmuramoyl-tripeptide--D-alanyl-D-alanine ligase
MILDFTHSLQYAGISLILASMFLICSLKGLAILQQCGYKNGKTFRWYKRKDNMLFQRYALLATMLFLLSALVGISFSLFGEEAAALLSLIPFVAFCLLFYFADKKYALKVPVQETERLKRLALVYFVLLAVILYFLVALFNVIAYYANNTLISLWRYVPLSLMPLLLLFILFFANLLDGIYENIHNKKYIALAKGKLSPSAVKIGITGSYGKTTVKNILAAMLSKKYKVLATPASFNTPMGIAKCVNGSGADYEVFIAEMGARKAGDIAELCELVKPNYSLLTGVCGQHIESFGSVENVLAAKSEIVGGTDGPVFVGKDENTAKIVGENVTFVGESWYKNVRCTADGTSFVLVAGGKETPIFTRLLGAHTAKNIALAAALALQLGVSLEEIAEACKELDYIPHRLQVLHGENGVTVLDDSYNANIEGASRALEVLQLFPGKKIVVTPGIVELGILEEEVNARLGSMLVEADHVILVGDSLVAAVKNGYLAAGGEVENLQTVFTLEQAKGVLSELVTAGDTVLFLNDLPDIY